MTNVIDMEAARQRIEATSPQNPIVQALDALAVALVDHDHQWTDKEVGLYENALFIATRTDSGSSA